MVSGGVLKPVQAANIDWFIGWYVVSSIESARKQLGVIAAEITPACRIVPPVVHVIPAR